MSLDSVILTFNRVINRTLGMLIDDRREVCPGDQ